MQVGAADPAPPDLDEDVVGAERRYGELLDLERGGSGEHGGGHRRRGVGAARSRGRRPPRRCRARRASRAVAPAATANTSSAIHTALSRHLGVPERGHVDERVRVPVDDGAAHDAEREVREREQHREAGHLGRREPARAVPEPAVDGEDRARPGAACGRRRGAQLSRWRNARIATWYTIAVTTIPTIPIIRTTRKSSDVRSSRIARSSVAMPTRMFDWIVKNVKTFNTRCGGVGEVTVRVVGGDEELDHQPDADARPRWRRRDVGRARRTRAAA